MSWLPRITNTGCCICLDDGEIEGVGLLIEWFGFGFEICLGRHNGRCH